MARPLVVWHSDWNTSQCSSGSFSTEEYGVSIGFAQWLVIGIPASVLMLAVTGWWLSQGGYQLNSTGSQSVNIALQEQREKQGTLQGGEKAVAIVFVITAVSWIVRPWLNGVAPWLSLSDTGIALMAMLALFILPAGFRKLEFLMTWQDMRRLPWDVLLLFGED